jgi:CYTH domain-containing protein
MALMCFEGRHAGLVLAEVGFETADEYERFQKPDFALEDVTTDMFFTGGNLATVPESTLHRVLDERLGRS